MVLRWAPLSLTGSCLLGWALELLRAEPYGKLLQAQNWVLWGLQTVV